MADDATVDRLLDRDRHDHPATGADGGEQPRHAQPLTQHRRFLEPATDGVDRREATDRLRHGRAPTTRLIGFGFGLTIRLERLDERAIPTAGRHQIGVRTVGRDPSELEVDDLVGEGDRRRPRGDDHDGRVSE